MLAVDIYFSNLQPQGAQCTLQSARARHRVVSIELKQIEEALTQLNVNLKYWADMFKRAGEKKI